MAAEIQDETLVLGGIHGNETEGISLVQSLQNRRIKCIHAFNANEGAVELGERYVDDELSNCSDKRHGYEGGIFWPLVQRCRPYKFIISPHNALDPETNEAYIDHPPAELYVPIRWVLGKMAVKNVIRLKNPVPLDAELSQMLSIDQGLPENDYFDWERKRIKRWRAVLREMATIGLQNLQPNPLGKDLAYFEWLGDISRNQAKACGLDALPLKLKRYDRLPDEAVTALGLDNQKGGAYHVLSSGYNNMSPLIPDTSGEREYWGTIVKRVEPFL